MSQNYVGCCKQVYDSLSVWWLVYVTIKECICSGKEGNILTVSNTLKHTCSKGPLSNDHFNIHCEMYCTSC